MSKRRGPPGTDVYGTASVGFARERLVRLLLCVLLFAFLLRGMMA